MKKLLVMAALVGLMAAPVLAEPAQTNVTRVNGTFSAPVSDGVTESIAIESIIPPTSIPYTPGTENYDNWPSVLGGLGTGGSFGFPTPVAGTWAYFRWTNPTAQWGDDIHGIIDGASKSLTHLHYGFFDGGGSLPHSPTHVIKIYDMNPPSVTHSATIVKGQLLLSTSVVWNLPSSGAFNATLTFSPIHLLSDSIWIKFWDPNGGTWWLTGGIPAAPGMSHPGLVYGAKSYYGPGVPLNYFVGFPNLNTAAGAPLASNIAVALGKPEPATIGLLAIGGLLVLRRRRARA